MTEYQDLSHTPRVSPEFAQTAPGLALPWSNLNGHRRSVSDLLAAGWNLSSWLEIRMRGTLWEEKGKSDQVPAAGVKPEIKTRACEPPASAGMGTSAPRIRVSLSESLALGCTKPATSIHWEGAEGRGLSCPVLCWTPVPGTGRAEHRLHSRGLRNASNLPRKRRHVLWAVEDTPP